MAELRGSSGIPVPANGNFQGRGARGQPRLVAREAAVVDAIRSRFVADDLFSAFAHRELSLFRLDRSLAERARNVDPSTPSDVVRGPDFLSHIRYRQRSLAGEADLQSGRG